MRILQITTSYHGGGAERCSRELFHGLQQRGHDVEMWVGYLRGDEPPGVRTIRLPKEPIVSLLDPLPGIFDWRYVGSKLALREKNTRRFDVVHLHNLHSRWLSIKSVAALCRRQPAVWTLHDEWAVTGGMPYDLTEVISPQEAQHRIKGAGKPNWFPYMPGPEAGRWQRFLAENMPRPSRLIIPSQWLAKKAHAASWFKDVPITILPYGLTLLNEPAIQTPQEQARRHFSLRPDKPCILLIAANMRIPYKGMHLAMDALQKLAHHALPEQAKPSVLILGKDSDAMATQLTQATGWEVKQAWADDQQTLAMAYRAADFTIIPSLIDNFPYVALESLACQRPILCFDTGGLAEIAGQGQRGVTIPRFDADAMAMQIKKWLTHPDSLEPLRRRTQAWINEQSNPNDWISNTEAMYRQTIMLETQNHEHATNI